MKFLAFILFALVGLYAGIFLGIADCKRTFKIPKGVKTAEEYEKMIINSYEAVEEVQCEE